MESIVSIKNSACIFSVIVTFFLFFNIIIIIIIIILGYKANSKKNRKLNLIILLHNLFQIKII